MFVCVSADVVYFVPTYRIGFVTSNGVVESSISLPALLNTPSLPAAIAPTAVTEAL